MQSGSMNRQRGVFLIEALIGILIFSIGILALVAIQASAISAQSDAQYRMEAAKRAEQITSQMWLNVSRTNAASVATSLNTFQHQATGSNCNFSGTASTNTLVTDWVSTLTTAPAALPGATTAMQQIVVDTTAAAYNKVTVTVCWKAPTDAVARRHTVVTFVN
jgi:type IV pilus assembly protein PilV